MLLFVCFLIVFFWNKKSRKWILSRGKLRRWTGALEAWSESARKSDARQRGDRCTRMCRFSVHAETNRRGDDVNVQPAKAPWKLESGVNELHWNYGPGGRSKFACRNWGRSEYKEPDAPWSGHQGSVVAFLLFLPFLPTCYWGGLKGGTSGVIVTAF
jgi:hypothetical protein